MADDAIFKIVTMPYFSEISSHFDEILYAEVDLDHNNNPATRSQISEFKMANGHHIGNQYFWT